MLNVYAIGEINYHKFWSSIPILTITGIMSLVILINGLTLSFASGRLNHQYGFLQNQIHLIDKKKRILEATIANITQYQQVENQADLNKLHKTNVLDRNIIDNIRFWQYK